MQTFFDRQLKYQGHDISGLSEGLNFRRSNWAVKLDGHSDQKVLWECKTVRRDKSGGRKDINGRSRNTEINRQKD